MGWEESLGAMVALWNIKALDRRCGRMRCSDFTFLAHLKYGSLTVLRMWNWMKKYVREEDSKSRLLLILFLAYLKIWLDRFI